MDRGKRALIENWTIDYGDCNFESITVPHAWRQDVPVTFEGPVLYRTEIHVPRSPSMLRFHGVSYSAEVSIDGHLVTTHRGIWDAFDVPLAGHRGKTVTVDVKVVKNGGPTYPVKDVASGFLPYVFNTFGGIYNDVEIVPAESRVEATAASSRVYVDGHKLFVDGQPFYMRGLLHWGWYPDLGHPSASAESIRAEVRAVKSLGFNLIKFCLWVPPHRYLQILREEGMEAWMELPLWDPSSDPAKLQDIAEEIERIVRQYRGHDNVICWTVGCELSHATPPEYRQRLVQLIKNLTGCPLVKDNSGGAEMYGGDLREFGDFDDFHPYCDLPFYPPVLDSLLPGPRASRPVLLGEFNDIDVHKDVARVFDEMPYWASGLPELNDQGVRWLHELPKIVHTNRFAHEPGKNHHRQLLDASRKKAIFIRKFVHESVRAREAYSGYVVTGIKDTPISSSGFFDIWGDPKFTPHQCAAWNGEDVLFEIPVRRPPWVTGGNRPGWLDSFNHFAGQIFFRIGLHSQSGMNGGLIWRILDDHGIAVAQGALDQMDVPPLESCEVGQISWRCDTPGAFQLIVEFGGARNEWPFNVFAPLSDNEKERIKSPSGVRFLGEHDSGVLPMPFWREAAIEFKGHSWGLAERWERLLAISPDLVLDPASLPEHEVIVNRIDVRTYQEHPIAVKTADGIITTLRPQGGLGIQPQGIERNPSGVELLRAMKAI
jgi:hypothetical protein